jgi:hypothetical protein
MHLSLVTKRLPLIIFSPARARAHVSASAALPPTLPTNRHRHLIHIITK